MTTEEFNNKYKKFLEPKFCGLTIEDSDIINLCDKYFKQWTKVQGFHYYQIKNKFNTARVYCDNVNVNDLENEINMLLK